jgi:serpin B
MKKTFLFATLMLLAGMLTGCGEVDNPVGDPYTRVVYMLPKAQKIELSYDQRQLVMKNNDFSLNLFRTINELDKEKKSNFLSPISVTYLLSMLNDGAAGDTSKEIMAMLGFAGSDTKSINELCKALIDGAPEVDPAVSVDISSYIAANSHLGVQLEDLFRKDMETYYRAEAASLDFSSPDALKTINGWCYKKTDGKIEKILDELDADALLVLMNAVNFKATWVRKFDEKNTQTETFTKDDGKTVQIPMMHQEALILYGSNSTYSRILLPFGGTNALWYMHILLPNEGKTVDDVLNTLNAKDWRENWRNTDVYQLDIKIPRFTTTAENDLVPSIKKLGAPSIFDPKKADFSKMCSNYKDLYVNELLQKAAIDVNEKGSEAVAVTLAGMNTTAPGSDPKWKKGYFYCDTPFVYLIEETSSGAIFFIGTFRGE